MPVLLVITASVDAVSESNGACHYLLLLLGSRFRIALGQAAIPKIETGYRKVFDCGTRNAPLPSLVVSRQSMPAAKAFTVASVATLPPFRRNSSVDRPCRIDVMIMTDAL